MFLERTMMNKLNYFQLLCLFWAALGFGSRLFMSLLGERWNKWEMKKHIVQKTGMVVCGGYIRNSAYRVYLVCGIYYGNYL